LAGAAGAAALTLLLFVLGAGLGFSVASPWPQAGATATTLGVSAIIWLTFTQLASSGLGGYLAGRLRTKWKDAPNDEVFFRDSVHGFLAWAVATIAMATLLTSAITASIETGMQAGATMSQMTPSNEPANPTLQRMARPFMMEENYYIDSLFRREPGAAVSTEGANNRTEGMSDVTPEITRIFNINIRTGALPAEDLRYIGQLVAQRTGLSQQDAERRVSTLYSRAQERMQRNDASAREAADQARKASAYTALWLSVSLLIGAFVASLAATYGGRRRDL
jgi:hypothetical protein